jgi:hypothetical protein
MKAFIQGNLLWVVSTAGVEGAPLPLCFRRQREGGVPRVVKTSPNTSVRDA